MARLSRAKSQALTRERLLAAASELFAREGYATTSVDRIAAAAGYSKGAVYSNFEGKEAIFLAVLERQGQEALDALLAGIAAAPDAAGAIELLAAWADARSGSGTWSLTILEHARLAAPGAPSLRRQEAIIRDHWRQLGEGLRRRFPGLAGEGETLGALLHEIAYAPALTFIARPRPGDLVRLAMARLLA
ncbi:TetR/AcrR family transcriptional regulator [Roseicella frigidaeris]|uniref:TetR/AcrR family transcriptional regulator n=1 Tax=Roseicella frigidaeris TaxID=2230885 RepID=A0A327MLX6_9PROT|nr:TetR/AcrR family transcriptional regulator [Roseicella frigidaeris]RAI61138.1 TetR/AcrR family transcriptional regulator [Roseicella frigidaeris]